LWVFGAGLEAGWLWLVVVGLITAIIGLYYYLTVLKVMYLYRSEDEGKPLVLGNGWKLVMLVCAVGIVVLGVVIVPFYHWAGVAAAGLH
jgi:NADH-quinone oxidoreductase subunit N